MPPIPCMGKKRNRLWLFWMIRQTVRFPTQAQPGNKEHTLYYTTIVRLGALCIVSQGMETSKIEELIL